MIAERIVQLGGVAHGTALVAVQRARLEPYPQNVATGMDHCNAISSALALFGANIRKGIDDASRADDQDTADIYTEISRGIDKWLWFVEAHIQVGE